MKRLMLALLLLPIFLADSFAAEDWLGLEDYPLFSLGAELSSDQAGNLAAALDPGLALNDRARIHGRYQIYQLSDDHEEFESLSLATTLWMQVSQSTEVEIGHFFEGNFDQLEKESLGLALGFSQGNWNIRFEFEEGDLLIFTRNDLGNVFDRAIPDRIDSELSSYAVSLGWQKQQWYWQASHKRYDYEVDLSRLNNSSLIQLIVKSAALAQTSLLISENTAIIIGHADYDDDYSIWLLQDRSAIDHLVNNSLVLNWQHWGGENLAYLLTASFPGQSEALGLSLGLRWVM